MYRKVLAEINWRQLPGEEITHCDRKYLNNRIESDHAALRLVLGPKGTVRNMRSTKVTLTAIETFRAIKRGHIMHLATLHFAFAPGAVI